MHTHIINDGEYNIYTVQPVVAVVHCVPCMQVYGQNSVYAKKYLPGDYICMVSMSNHKSNKKNN